VELSPGEADFPDRSDVDAYYERALAALEGVPGVRAAATTVPLPMNHELLSTPYAAPEQVGTDTEDWSRAMYFRVSDGYFESMGIELLAGRLFDPRDGSDSEPTVIISEGVARRLWPGQDAVGRVALLGNAEAPTEARVVGLAEDVAEEGFADVFGGQIYRPAAQSYRRSRYIVVGIDGPPSMMINPVSEALRAAGPAVPALVRPMRAVVDENALGWSVPSLLLGVAGLIAIGLASLGIYGLISYQTLQRRTEMGVRLALGATAAQVRMDVMREGIRLAVPGLLVGLALSVGAGQLLASRLYGIGPRDPLTFIGTAVLFAAVAVAAAARPAVRAGRTAPVRVLKAD
ncbi:MAG: FtsX-like permease family protein, partial [Gemmatimonadetes bacterium]|nr:FtsX-like permease family protein [Gemmatimonadota bacterium]